MTQPLNSADIRIFSPEINNFSTLRNTDIDCILVNNFSFNFFEPLKVVLINMVAILMMPVKLANLGLLKVKVF